VPVPAARNGARPAELAAAAVTEADPGAAGPVVAEQGVPGPDEADPEGAGLIAGVPPEIAG
jgi:hypothetical protein